jgi:catechol 2,3-dioxygenase-like lactoylglutathione lyase family enzyme
MRLHHLAIKSKDPEELARFYRALGLEELRRHDDDRGLRSIWLALGDAILMIERSTTGGPNVAFESDPPGLHLLAFAIEPHEAPAWRARLPIVRETEYTLYFADPEGNRVALSSHPEPLAR